MNDVASAVTRQARGRFDWRGLAPWAISVIVLVLIGLFVHSNTAFTIFNVMAINIVFALSYNMQLGQGGLLSFGHAVFLGFGGFAAIHAMNAIGAAAGFWGHFPVVALPLIGFVAGAVAAIVIGWPFCRHSGLAYAMITLGLGALIPSAAQLFPSIFGGTSGVYSDRVVGPLWFGRMLHASDVYWFMLFWVFVAALAMWAFSRTPLGRMSNAMRDNSERLRFIGYSPRNMRFLVFIVSSAFAGMAGGMAAVNYEIMTSHTLSLVMSGEVLLMAAVGGYGVFYGPILGAILIVAMNSLLSDYTQASVLYVGVVFLAIVLFAPRGLAGGTEAVRRAWRERELAHRWPGWAIGTLGVILSAAGLITLVELVYQARHGEDNIALILGISFDPREPWGWIVMLVLLAAGYAVFRVTRKYREAKA